MKTKNFKHHTEASDENRQKPLYNNDCDNDFHMKHNVYEVHEYDVDKKHNEYALILENDPSMCFPTVKRYEQHIN